MSAEKNDRIPAGEKGTADRIEADGGAYWVRLVTRQALDREGAAMAHCVGNGGYDNLVGGEEIYDDSIWSLRRADGASILTVRIQDHEVDYAKGPENHEPGRGASMQIRHLVAAYKKCSRHRLVVNEVTGITLLMDGRTYRIDRLPADAAAARARSERVIAAPFDRVEIRSNESPRRERLRWLASPEAKEQRRLQDEAYDRDIARILGRVAGRPWSAIQAER